ncbi:MAG: chemotaxis protein CheX [Muricomes sp.]
MNNVLYDPFMEATRNVFQLMLDLSDVSHSVVEGFENNDGLDVSIGVIGDLAGEVVYHFPEDTSLSMVNIMSGMEIDSVDEFVTSAISEIANIISGNVLTELAQSDMKCDILPPVLCTSGEDKDYELMTSCLICTDAGTMGVDIKLNQA